MRILLFLFSLFFCLSASLAQDSFNVLDFSLLRQNDEIKINADKNLYLRLKEISLGKETMLSFGGSHRFQVEGFVNQEFDKEKDQSDHWYLNRSMLHGHLKSTDWFELFVEFNTSLINSKTDLSPVDKDQLGMNQFFINLQLEKNWSLKIGRQNLRLGSGRLIDIREGPNVRLSFDLIDFKYQDNNTNISAFIGGPVRVNTGIFDNDIGSSTEYLAGVYWTQKWSDEFNSDAYMIFKNEDDKSWNSGTADDQRLSLGFRYFGELHGIIYNNELVYQIGNFGDQDIRAWTISFDVKKEISLRNSHLFNLGIRTELISGDRNSDDNSLNTFDGLYPRGAYFGRVARFGPSNLFDIHPYLEFQISSISFEFDYVAFWRLSAEDGVYGPPLNLAYPDLNNERFIGHQIGGIIGYSLSKNIALEVESNVIFPGDFLDLSGLGDNLIHVVFTSEIKF